MLSSVLVQVRSGCSPRPGLPAACCGSARAQAGVNWSPGLVQSLWLPESGLVPGSKRHLPAGPKNWVTVAAEAFPPCSVSTVSQLGHSAATTAAPSGALPPEARAQGRASVPRVWRSLTVPKSFGQWLSFRGSALPCWQGACCHVEARARGLVCSMPRVQGGEHSDCDKNEAEYSGISLRNIFEAELPFSHCFPAASSLLPAKSSC